MTTVEAKELFLKAHRMLNSIKDKNNKIYDGPGGLKIRKRNHIEFNFVVNRLKIYYLTKLSIEPKQSNEDCGCS